MRGGYQSDHRVVIPRLIFAQALKIVPVTGPRRLPRGQERAIHRDTQHLSPAGPQIRLNAQRLRQIEPSAQAPGSEARALLDADARSRPNTAPKQGDLGRPGPKQDWIADDP